MKFYFKYFSWCTFEIQVTAVKTNLEITVAFYYMCFWTLFYKALFIL